MQIVQLSQAIVMSPLVLVLLVLQTPTVLELVKDAPLLEATPVNASQEMNAQMLTLQDSVIPTCTATPRQQLLDLILLPALLIALMMLLALTPPCTTQETSAKLLKTLLILTVLQSAQVVNAQTLF